MAAPGARERAGTGGLPRFLRAHVLATITLDYRSRGDGGGRLVGVEIEVAVFVSGCGSTVWRLAPVAGDMLQRLVARYACADCTGLESGESCRAKIGYGLMSVVGNRANTQIK